MDTKTEQAKKFIEDEKYFEALKIFQTFKMNLSKDNKSTLKRTHEMSISERNKSFYETLGYNYKEEIQKSIIIMKNYFNHAK